MTPRERQLAAIRHQVTDRISSDAIAVENLPEVAAYWGVSQSEAYERLGIDGRIVAAPYIGQQIYMLNGLPVNEWGSDANEDYGQFRGYPMSLDTTVAEIEQYKWPDAKDYDYATPAANAAVFSQQYAYEGHIGDRYSARVAL